MEGTYKRMGKVIILPEEIRNKIAAGEVVERPVSVVKELVENSIDAGARRIVIEIINAGETLISVTDNGEGMSKDDAILALNRFATSKIKNMEDLFKIKTLGFRGEALASIASVSKMEIRTKTEKDNGVFIRVEGGNILDILPWEGSIGTSIRVKDLFYNVPARKKFLKSRTTESNLIVDFVKKIALAYPDISFQYIEDGKTKFTTLGSGKIGDVIIEVLKNINLNDLIEFENTHGDYSIWGLLSKPGKLVSIKPQDFFFVNKRWVRNLSIFQALKEGYKGRILEGYYPFAILFLNVPYDEVDVNVHPTKREVKFEKEKEIFSFIENSIKKALENYEKKFKLVELDHNIKINEENYEIDNKKINKENIQLPLTSIEKAYISEKTEKYLPKKSFGFRIVGQIFDNYVIVETGDRVFIIDQHAAHERIRYERLKEELNLGLLQNVEIILPIIIDISLEDKKRIEEKREILEKFAFSWEDFGPNRIRLIKVPYEFLNFDPVSIENLFKEIISEINEKDLEVLEDKIIKSLACHGAIRSGDVLIREEMEALIQMIFDNQIPITCPHGRPYIWEIKKEELEKYFHRK
jgi:DNA mismatch repair protein MutL